VPAALRSSALEGGWGALDEWGSPSTRYFRHDAPEVGHCFGVFGGDVRRAIFEDASTFKVANLRARRLRSNMTEGERRLWFLLRKKRLAGFRFRRQVPIGPYVADFFCPSARLIY